MISSSSVSSTSPSSSILAPGAGEEGVHRVEDGLFICGVNDLFENMRGLRRLKITHVLNVGGESLYSDAWEGRGSALRKLLQPFRVCILEAEDEETQDMLGFRILAVGVTSL